MRQDQLRPDLVKVEQLALGLDLQEADRDQVGFVSPEEAQRRSESARLALKARGVDGEDQVWMETYQGLLNAGWPWRVACYVAWASSPKVGRWPGTQLALAQEVLGLTSDRVIATWRKRNSAIDEMVAVLQAAPLMEHRADVLRALASAASNPSHQYNPDRKLFLEMTGDFVPRQKVELNRGEADDLSGLTDAELDRLAGTLRPGSSPDQAGSGEEGDGVNV
jgi:hypothetical protein